MRIRLWLIRFILTVAITVSTQTQTSANELTGDYYGTATITSPAGLGTIDLAFHLELDAGGKIISDSYVILDKTILFPVVAPQVGGKNVGPRATGTLNLTSGLDLVCGNFTTKVSAGASSEKTVTRRIILDGNNITQAGNSISGTYRETMTGYLSNPVTVIGTFVLVRPVPITVGFPVCQDTEAPLGWLSLKEIRAGGNDPSQVEFEDLSCAMQHKKNPDSGLNVSDQVMIDAINEYQSSLQ